MNLTKIRLWPYAVISLAQLFLMPIFNTSLRLSFLIPCLVVLFYQRTFIFCLWSSFFSGLLLELLSSESFLGLYVTSYCCAAAIIYPQKKHFFADNLSTLPILTCLTSVCVTFSQVLLIYIFQKEVLLNWSWFATNILFMPFFDSAYAFFLFLMPTILFGKRRRHGKDFFMHRSNMD